MAAWLLTWNKDKYPFEEYEDYCEEASKDSPIEFTWSCHSKQTKIGDEFFLIKLGKEPRGIVAHGVITEENFEDIHWDDNEVNEDKTVNYVPIKFDTLLNYKTQEILEIEILKKECPQQFGSAMSSGISIKDEVLSTLHELWRGVTKEYPENPEESFYNSPDGATEGAKKLVYTTKYERDPKVRRAFLKDKILKCEVCGFDFEKTYGNLGKDLVMLCSNCHRMIHRGKDHMITVEELKEIILVNTENYS